MTSLHHHARLPVYTLDPAILEYSETPKMGSDHHRPGYSLIGYPLPGVALGTCGGHGLTGKDLAWLWMTSQDISLSRHRVERRRHLRGYLGSKQGGLLGEGSTALLGFSRAWCQNEQVGIKSVNWKQSSYLAQTRPLAHPTAL